MPRSVLHYDVDKDLTSIWYSVFTQFIVDLNRHKCNLDCYQIKIKTGLGLISILKGNLTDSTILNTGETGDIY